MGTICPHLSSLFFIPVYFVGTFVALFGRHILSSRFVGTITFCRYVLSVCFVCMFCPYALSVPYRPYLLSARFCKRSTCARVCMIRVLKRLMVCQDPPPFEGQGVDVVSLASLCLFLCLCSSSFSFVFGSDVWSNSGRSFSKTTPMSYQRHQLEKREY